MRIATSVRGTATPSRGHFSRGHRKFHQIPPKVPPDAPGFTRTLSDVTGTKKPAKPYAITGFRILSDVLGWVSGVGDRTRTGKPLGGGFSSHYVFRRRARRVAASPFVRWTMPSPSPRARSMRRAALGAPRLVSTPSAPSLARQPAWLGVASAPPACAARPRGFAEFEGFCTSRFQPGTQSLKSAMFTNFITPTAR